MTLQSAPGPCVPAFLWDHDRVLSFIKAEIIPDDNDTGTGNSTESVQYAHCINKIMVLTNPMNTDENTPGAQTLQGSDETVRNCWLD